MKKKAILLIISIIIFIILVFVVVNYFMNMSIFHYSQNAKVPIRVVAPRYAQLITDSQDSRILNIKGNGFFITLLRNKFDEPTENGLLNQRDPRGMGEVILELPYSLSIELKQNPQEVQYDALLAKLGYSRVTSGTKKLLYNKKIYRKGQTYYTPSDKDPYVLFRDLSILNKGNMYDTLNIEVAYSSVDSKSTEKILKISDDIIMSIEDISVYLKNKSK